MSTSRPDIAELEPHELEGALASVDAERFHARQVYRWIHKRGETDFERMTDLARPLRARLADAFTIDTPAIVSDECSIDGTRKLVL